MKPANKPAADIPSATVPLAKNVKYKVPAKPVKRFTKPAKRRPGRPRTIAEVVPAAAAPPPPPPNPVVIKLQEEILELLHKRDDARQQADDAAVSIQVQQQRSQAMLAHQQNGIRRIDEDIQYRFRLIEQMGGGPMLGEPRTLAPYRPQPVDPSPIIFPGAGSYDFGAHVTPLSETQAPLPSFPQGGVVGSIPATRQAPQQQVQDDGVNRGFVTDEERMQ